ncbi:MAG TPA: hypothetical protein VIK01_03795, partial [Polyangiaceae bacterium]
MSGEERGPGRARRDASAAEGGDGERAGAGETGEYERGARAKSRAGGATESGREARRLGAPEPTGTLRGLELGLGSKPGELVRGATSGKRMLSTPGCD